MAIWSSTRWQYGGFDSEFSVSFGPKLRFRLWIWTWTKLNNKSEPTNLQFFIPVGLQSTSKVDTMKAYKSTAFSF